MNMFYRPFVKFLLFCDLSLEAPRPERDVYTNRIREPEKQYTVLTDIQKKNIKNVRNSNKIMISHPPLHKVFVFQNPEPFFHNFKKEPFPKGPFHVPRYTDTRSQFNCRGVWHTKGNPFGFITERYENEPPEAYNCSRGMAAVKWGPNKTGKVTKSTEAFFS